jgi:hypothetical protein
MVNLAIKEGFLGQVNNRFPPSDLKEVGDWTLRLKTLVINVCEERAE